jgi:hypothetical protein
LPTITSPADALDALRTSFTGELHAPGDDGYDAARSPWNLAAEQLPALVARPRTVDDVVAVVRYAGAAGLRVAPRGTGHNACALGDLATSVLLRTDLMRAVTIDAERRTARAEAGALCLDVNGPASELGLTGLMGSSPDVGVVGYALGGGIGWLARSLGLCCNTVVAVEVVTADGAALRCDADTHAELFWALRGGGGSFAVVTAIELELVALDAVYAGALLWPWEQAREVLQAWRAWTVDAPESVTTSARLLQVPPMPDIPEIVRGRNFVVLDGAVLGSVEHAEEVLAPLRALQPEIDMFAMVPPAALSRIHMDPENPTPAISDHAMLDGLTAEHIDAIVDVAGPGSGSPLVMVELRHLGGALQRAPEGAGVRATLDGDYILFALGVPMTPEVGAAIGPALGQVHDAVASAVSGRSYLNFAERRIDAATAFEGSYARLQEVKAQYDPRDTIQSNHPVALPTA